MNKVLEWFNTLGGNPIVCKTCNGTKKLNGKKCPRCKGEGVIY